MDRFVKESQIKGFKVNRNPSCSLNNRLIEEEKVGFNQPQIPFEFPIESILIDRKIRLKTIDESIPKEPIKIIKNLDLDCVKNKVRST